MVDSYLFTKQQLIYMENETSLLTGQKEILTKKEVSQLLGINVRTVDKMDAQGTIKSYRLSGLTGKKFFKYSEIYRLIFGETQTAKRA